MFEFVGEFYLNGIFIWSEDDMEKIIKEYDIDVVVFVYFDVFYEYVMYFVSRVYLVGVDFWFFGLKSIMFKLSKFVVVVIVVRIGCGKS